MAYEVVPFLDMQARLAPIRAELLEACARVIDSGIFVMGPEVHTLEQEFSAFYGVPHAVAVSNGTAALQLALLAADVRPGDEVITVANTFIATVEAITAAGAIPVFVDVDPDTYLMDAAACARAVTSRTRAIIPVHLYGMMCDMDSIIDIARVHRLSVIEDACQAHGATLRGAAAGSLGDFGCFSFYPGKNLGTIGEGGMLVSRHADAAERARRLRSHGERRRYEHAEPGFNMRLSEIQAAGARVQLRRVAQWNADRRMVANWYAGALAHLPVQLPRVLPDREHAFHLYVVQTEERDRVRAELETLGIGTGIHYPVPVHRQEAYRDAVGSTGTLRVTEAAASRLLSLPMFPELRQAQVEYVADALGSALRSFRDGRRRPEPRNRAEGVRVSS